MLAPTDFFTNYSFDTGTDTISIPIANLPVLSEAEANASTGDGREVVRALVEAATLSYEALPAEDKPKSLTISRGSIVGVNTNTIRRTYTFTFEETISAVSTTLKPEPA